MRTVEACNGGVFLGSGTVLLVVIAAIVIVDGGVVAGGGVIVELAVEEGGAEREHLGERDAATRPAPDRPAAVGPRRQVAGAVGRRAGPVAAAGAVLGGGKEEQEAVPEAVRAHADQELPGVEVAEQGVAALLCSAVAAISAAAAQARHVAHGFNWRAERSATRLASHDKEYCRR